MGVYKNLKDKTFGRLLCIKDVGRNKHSNVMWLCKCECGGSAIVVARDLINGHTQSCGCLQREKVKHTATKHGKNGTRLYSTWRNMKARCNNPNVSNYKDYGGRGIKVCDEWEDDFMAFYNWAMYNGYRDDLTIERINVDGNYEPINCTWIPKSEQSKNTRIKHMIEYKGETMRLSEWAELYDINVGTLASRIRTGWSIEKALNTPVQKRWNNET